MVICGVLNQEVFFFYHFIFYVPEKNLLKMSTSSDLDQEIIGKWLIGFCVKSIHFYSFYSFRQTTS